MACRRCGTNLAADIGKVRAQLSAPSGDRLYLEIIVKASTDALGLRPEMFCEACWLWWLSLFGEIGKANALRES